MTPDKEAIRAYFYKLGLASEIADIYLALHVYGPQTISELSRAAHIERTRIYRLIDQLMESGLIEVETHYKRGILISKREQELQSLTDELQLVEQVLGRNSLNSPASRVQFYQGPEGIKQMFWNETKANTEVLSILYQNMQIKTNSRFFERWITECNAKNLHFRGVVGPEFIKSQEQWYGTANGKRLNHWDSRVVSEDQFQISHSTVIYNDVVAHYIWKDGEIFGTETYNKDIATTERQLFELLWNTAVSPTL
jgi:sugar-specific transcriptional regulator TrmB